jgi:ABC-type Fe3+-siderophore transport system permease subunit
MRSRWIWLALLTVIALAAGLALGATSIPVVALWAGLRDSAAEAAPIIRELRLPRVLLGFLVGGGLAVSGAVLQALVRNPLADPFVLGISGGATLGAVAAISAGLASPWAVPFAAFLGALATLLLVYRLSLVAGRRLDSNVLLLAGVVVSSFTMALVTAILMLVDATRLQNSFRWMLGGLWSASWTTVEMFALYAIVPLGLLQSQARSLDLLALGEEPARHLGADPERVKRIAYLATGFLTAVAVATSGAIGFVGLLVPHAVRRLWGPLHAALLPSVFLAGGGFLVLADALARAIAPPVELPVGVVTALVGVPLFAILLRRRLA